MFLGFGLDAWITIVTVLGMFSVLLFTKLRSDLVFLSAIGVLYVTGVLDAKEAFSGFSGTSVITVGVLYAHRSAHEHHHPRCQHRHREYHLSVDAVTIKAMLSPACYSNGI